MDIGTVCGMIILDSVPCYKIFNGTHHGNPVYY